MEVQHRGSKYSGNGSDSQSKRLNKRKCPLLDGATVARCQRNTVSRRCQGFSLIEVLISMALLAITSVLLLNHLQQLLLADVRQWRARSAWQIAAQLLEGKENKDSKVQVELLPGPAGCQWQKVTVLGSRVELRRLVCCLERQNLSPDRNHPASRVY